MKSHLSKKPTRFVGAIVLHLALIVICGCSVDRFVSVVDVKDSGDEIETRNRYRLVKFYDANGKLSEGSVKDTGGVMIKKYPKVFSEQGIPFSMHASYAPQISPRSTIQLNPRFFSSLLSVGSAFIIPSTDNTQYLFSYTITFDDGEERGKFNQWRRHDWAISLSPFALTTLKDSPQAPLRGKYFHDRFTSLDNRNTTMIVCEALAYAVAVTLKNLEDAGSVNVTNQSVGVTKYEIMSCEREAGNDFAYRFELELIGEKSLRSFRVVQQEFRLALKEDYLESFSKVEPDSIHVDFSEYRQKGSRIEGRAIILPIVPVALTYDPSTRMGVLSVRFNENQFEDARVYVRKNIEMLARDKNIALATGEIPPVAKFYLGREEIKDGNILEIEFRTE